MNYLLLTILGITYAWDNQGHRIIGLIAGRYVKDRTAIFLEKNLDDFSVNAVPEGLAYISIQADMKQNDTAYAWASPMHYAYTDQQCSPYDEKRDCPGGVCIVSAIAKFSTIASNPKLSRSDREEALMFLIHFMGDIHQPLHVGFYRDDGGSKLWLSDPDTHLHDVWDSVIVTRLIKKGDPIKSTRKWNYYTLADDLVDEMESSHDSENQAKMISVPSDTSSYKLMNAFAADLASETTGLYTCKLAYRNERGRWIQPGDMLTKTYLDDRWKIVKKQYMVAGRRLASLLDSIADTFYAKEKEARQVMLTTKLTRNVPEVKKQSNRFNGLPIDFGSDSGEDSSEAETDDDDKKKKKKQAEGLSTITAAPVPPAAPAAIAPKPKTRTFAQIVNGQTEVEDDDLVGIVSKSRSIIKKKKNDLRGRK